MRRAGCPRSDGLHAQYVAAYDALLRSGGVAYEEHDVPTTFGTTHVVTAGDPANPPLVALHAKSSSSAMWGPLLPTLTASHRVLLVDAVNDQNKSVQRRSLTGRTRIAGWLDEVLDAHGIDDAVFIGASLGTFLSVHYALERPARVRALALLCPAGIFERVRLRWMVHGARAMTVRPTRERVMAFLDTTAEEAGRAALRRAPWSTLADVFIGSVLSFKLPLDLPMVPRRVPPERLRGIRVPTLVVIGAQESLADGPALADAARATIPGAQVELLEGANHLVFVDRQARVEELVAGFLAARVQAA